jgi:predicted RNase H-like HicB family nuclease
VFNYSYRAEWSAEDAEYIATSAEFPGATAFGATPDEAIRELQAAIEGIIEVMVEDGQPVPEPIPLPDYSGQFRLRLPKSLHARLSQWAELEGVSANALAQTFIACGLQNDFTGTRASLRLERAIAVLEEAAKSAAASAASIEGSGSTFFPFQQFSDVIATSTSPTLAPTVAPFALPH